ncbi:flagellar protein FlaF [Rhizomicrobium palustre]|uniref:Flagellar protein FlaF n=1 Tax=Rhizomicrobium palustre TaxID=189966 RepID=A0A846MXX2_9PROT|nr:flagellar biosynthesis regulator FlaF [Rhizomicrobium palustre]NIK88075.1 flagellar protein FlaF [Rhizomicrobium palustre]
MEYRLFGQVTGAMLSAQRENKSGGSLAEVVDSNRKLWRLLAADCLDNSNRLPEGLRANIVSLSLFVTRYSKDVIRSGAPLDPLIDINRSIMQGLEGQG